MDLSGPPAFNPRLKPSATAGPFRSARPAP